MEAGSLHYQIDHSNKLMHNNFEEIKFEIESLERRLVSRLECKLHIIEILLEKNLERLKCLESEKSKTA